MHLLTGVLPACLILCLFSLVVGMRLTIFRQPRWWNQTRSFMCRGPADTSKIARTWRARSITGVKSLLLKSVLLSKVCYGATLPARQLSVPVMGTVRTVPDLALVNSQTVRKRALDERDYKALTLDNGMRVLLISDPKSSRSAAALDVHAGSFSDPPDRAGLAHFCEHMSFLGTKKYPEENEFSEFLSANGGSSNAFTDSEDTVYYFDVNTEQLRPALDRFAQFFSAPLMTESAVLREVKAIDAEHAKNINSDNFRLHQLDRDAANPAHPLHNFITGNKETLLHATTNTTATTTTTTTAADAGAELRQQLLTFHRENYVGSRMTLAVIGKQSLPDLEAWVKECFTPIPRGSGSGREGGDVEPAPAWWGKLAPFLPQTSAALTEVVPVAESRSVTLSWPVWIQTPEQRADLRRYKPEFPLTHLLGHEGAGSLRAALVRRGWANSLQAYIGTDVTDCQVFDVHIDLTGAGHQHRHQVVEVVLAYVDLLQRCFVAQQQEGGQKKGLPNYLLDELATMTGVAFNYSEKSDPSSYVTSLASNMQIYRQPSDYLTGATLFSQPNQSAIAGYLSHFTPQNLRIMSVAPEFQGKTTQTERYYGTAYRSVSLADGTADERQWWKRLQSVRAQDYPELHLPAVNDLIPRNFDLIGPQTGVEMSITGEAEATSGSDNPSSGDADLQVLMSPPTLIRNDARWQVWHKIDASFKQPKVYAIMDLAAPQMQAATPEFSAKGQLFASCFMESESEFLYTARLAGLSADVDVNNRGASIVLSGYSDKMALFAQKICAALRAYKPDAATFNRQKENFLRELFNFNTQQPISHSFYYANLALESGRYTVEETTTAVQRLTLHDLENFLQLNFGRSYGKALVVGNIDAVGAEKLVNIVQETLPFTALPQEERFKTAITILPTVRELNSEHTDHSTGGLRTSHPEPNAQDINSAASLYFHLPSRLPEDYMIVELLAEVLEQQFYSSLRTQQQLGYLVYANAGKREGVRSITFCVQSAIVDGAEITRRIEAFIANEMPAFLARLTETELEVYKQGLIGRRLEPDQRLTAQAGRFWAEIASQSVPDIVIQRDVTEVKVPAPRFDRRQTEVEVLRKITLSELRTFAHEFLGVGGAKRRVLVSQVTSQIPVPANKGASVADEAKEAVVVGREGVAAASGSLAVPDKLEVRYREIGGQEQIFRQSAQTI